MLYIKFTIDSLDKYKDLKKIYTILEEIKPVETSLDTEEWEVLIPTYAKEIIAKYYHEQPISKESFENFINYLEFSLEADFNELSIIDKNKALIKYTPIAYPYGGMERLLVLLRAFDCIPTECYNGFTVYQFKWNSLFDHDAIELPKQTEIYKASFKR